jgi:uncharacterized NAD(P)/FAD-binding protein YdhS
MHTAVSSRGPLMLAAQVNVPTIMLVIGGVVTTVAALGAAVAIFRQAAIKASLTTIIEANAELRKANDDLRRANDDVRTELQSERVKRAELEGRLSVFIDQFAERIVEAVMRTWRDTHPKESTS